MNPPDRLDAIAISEASAWCLRLAEGRLPPEARAEFDAWRDVDPRNASAFEDVVRTWQALEQTHLSPDLIAMRRSALDSFRRGHAAQWSRSSTRWRRSAAAIAAGVAVIGITAGLWSRFVPDRYEAGVGERRVIALEDGSKVSLDARSEVFVRYSGQRRELWLRRGRAKFQVARDALRPFSVSAGDKMVVATGTQFSVELLSSQVHVILYQGSVEVLAEHGSALQPVRWRPEPDAPAEPAGTQKLRPGRELVIAPAASEATLVAADPVRSLSWEAGQLVFNDETLLSAVERMNRYADVPLAIGDPAIGHIRISGTFLAGDTAAFVEGITGIFPVRVSKASGRNALVLAR